MKKVLLGMLLLSSVAGLRGMASATSNVATTGFMRGQAAAQLATVQGINLAVLAVATSSPVSQKTLGQEAQERRLAALTCRQEMTGQRSLKSLLSCGDARRAYRKNEKTRMVGNGKYCH